MLDSAELSDEELVTTYKEQGGVERGFRFSQGSTLRGMWDLIGH